MSKVTLQASLDGKLIDQQTVVHNGLNYQAGIPDCISTMKKVLSKTKYTPEEVNRMKFQIVDPVAG